MTKEIVKDVASFLEKASRIVSEFEHDSFSMNTYFECLEKDMESPIEHIFYIALKCLIQMNCLLISEPLDNQDGFSDGIIINPQQKISNYRVDFMITFYLKNKPKMLIVECDSQQFHERTEQERRYEKKRDRFFNSKGIHVFRFTGKEIKDEPFRVAGESLVYLTGLSIDDLIDPNFISEDTHE